MAPAELALTRATVAWAAADHAATRAAWTPGSASLDGASPEIELELLLLRAQIPIWAWDVEAAAAWTERARVLGERLGARRGRVLMTLAQVAYIRLDPGCVDLAAEARDVALAEGDAATAAEWPSFASGALDAYEPDVDALLRGLVAIDREAERLGLRRDAVAADALRIGRRALLRAEPNAVRELEDLLDLPLDGRLREQVEAELALSLAALGRTDQARRLLAAEHPRTPHGEAVRRSGHRRDALRRGAVARCGRGRRERRGRMCRWARSCGWSARGRRSTTAGRSRSCSPRSGRRRTGGPRTARRRRCGCWPRGARAHRSSSRSALPRPRPRARAPTRGCAAPGPRARSRAAAPSPTAPGAAQRPRARRTGSASSRCWRACAHRCGGWGCAATRRPGQVRGLTGAGAGGAGVRGRRPADAGDRGPPGRRDDHRRVVRPPGHAGSSARAPACRPLPSRSRRSARRRPRPPGPHVRVVDPRALAHAVRRAGRRRAAAAPRARRRRGGAGGRARQRPRGGRRAGRAPRRRARRAGPGGRRRDGRGGTARPGCRPGARGAAHAPSCSAPG